MPMRVTCVCGRQLLVADQLVGQPTVCPSCGHRFSPDGRTTDLRAYAEVVSPAPQDEPPDSEGPPDVSLRRQPSFVRRGLDDFGRWGLMLLRLMHYRIAYWGCAAVALAAAVGAALAAREMGRFDERNVPRRVSLAQLETSDVSSGDYVALTDFVPAEHYVVCDKLVKDKAGSKTYPANAHPPGPWEAVYVPLLPGAPGRAADAPPARERPWVRVVVQLTDVRSKAELREALSRPVLEGTLSRERVNDGTQALILRDYPSTDTQQLFVVLRPRPPCNDWVLVVPLALLLALAAAGTLLVYHVARRRGWLRPRPVAPW